MAPCLGWLSVGQSWGTMWHWESNPGLPHMLHALTLCARSLSSSEAVFSSLPPHTFRLNLGDQVFV